MKVIVVWKDKNSSKKRKLNFDKVVKHSSDGIVKVVKDGIADKGRKHLKTGQIDQNSGNVENSIEPNVKVRTIDDQPILYKW